MSEADNKTIGAAIQEAIDTQNFQRFGRVAEFYGYVSNNKNMFEFLSLPINNPEKFKDESVTTKWKKPTSIRDMYGALIKVYNVPFIKDLFSQHGTNVEDLIKEVEAFKKHAMEVAATQQESPKKEDQQKVEPKPKQSEDEHDTYSSGGDEDDNDEQPDTMIFLKDMQDLKDRLMMYCESLGEIENHTAKTIAKFIKFDVQRYLGALDVYAA